MAAIMNAVGKLDMKKLLSMDGPAVNWKVFSLIQEKLEKEYENKLLNVGSCGLHILNNCFKEGCRASSWDIDNFLSNIYWLFKDCPARREDFLNNSKLKKMPKKFCHHRWLESFTAAEQAVYIWEDVQSYVKAVEKGKFSKPACKSFFYVAQASKDTLMPVKLNFFISLIKIIQPFLTVYQRDAPMMPFLADDLKKIATDCLKTNNVMKVEYIEQLKTAYNFYSFDFNDKASYSCVSKISLGFIGDKLLKELLHKKEISEGQAQDIKRDAQSFIYTMLRNLSLKSPIKYAFVRHLSCLNPSNMLSSSYACYKKMKCILSTLTDCKKINPTECDEILLKFNGFLTNVSREHLQFDISDDRIDNFFHSHLNDKENYKKLWHVIKMLLVLSHGQAAVERGFSTNSHLEVENMKEEGYVAKRIILDELRCTGGLENFIITKELRNATIGARQKYFSYLEDKRKQKLNESEIKKRKFFDSELQELKLKKARIETAINELQKSADELSEKAEKTNCMKFVIQSNSFRRSAKERTAELENIDINIKNLQQNLMK